MSTTLADLLWGRDARSRAWLRRTTASGLMYLVACLIQAWGAHAGLISPRAAAAVIGWQLAGFGLAYALLPGRWGGEEFLLVLPDTALPDALLVLERARLALEQTAVSAGVPQLRVSFSAGLAACGPDGTLEHALEEADRGLYRAKAAGRGRCCLPDGDGSGVAVP